MFFNLIDDFQIVTGSEISEEIIYPFIVAL